MSTDDSYRYHRRLIQGLGEDPALDHQRFVAAMDHLYLMQRFPRRRRDAFLKAMIKLNRLCSHYKVVPGAIQVSMRTGGDTAFGQPQKKVVWVEWDGLSLSTWHGTTYSTLLFGPEVSRMIARVWRPEARSLERHPDIEVTPHWLWLSDIYDTYTNGDDT
jgi:hypothetical protein